MLDDDVRPKPPMKLVIPITSSLNRRSLVRLLRFFGNITRRICQRFDPGPETGAARPGAVSGLVALSSQDAARVAHAVYASLIGLQAVKVPRTISGPEAFGRDDLERHDALLDG